VLKKNYVSGFVLAFLLALVTGVSQAIADHDGKPPMNPEVELHFNHWHLYGRKSVYLKKVFKRQYPGIDVQSFDLRRVVVFAKSQRGRSEGTLRVGNHYSRTRSIYGQPDAFHDPDQGYREIAFKNPKRDSRGLWRLDLSGDLKLNRIVLVLEHSKRRHNNRYRTHNPGRLNRDQRGYRTTRPGRRHSSL